MWSFSRTLLTCWLTCSLAAGCATTRAAAPGPAGTAEAAGTPAPPERPEREPELPPPAGWPEHFPPRLLHDISGVDEVTGEPATVPRGYVFHRLDVEKIRVLRAREARCASDLAACEGRVAELAREPSFWNRWEGRALLIGLGFVAGTATTVGIAVGVSR